MKTIKKILMLVSVGVLLTLSISPTFAKAPDRLVSEYTTKELIQHFSTLYGANRWQLEAVGMCESSLRQVTNPNDGGSPSIGIFQYKTGTWERFSKLLGEELDINSIHDQIKLTSFIFAEYPQYRSHWTCSYKTGVLIRK